LRIYQTYNNNVLIITDLHILSVRRSPAAQ